MSIPVNIEDTIKINICFLSYSAFWFLLFLTIHLNNHALRDYVSYLKPPLFRRGKRSKVLVHKSGDGGSRPAYIHAQSARVLKRLDNLVIIGYQRSSIR